MKTQNTMVALSLLLGLAIASTAEAAQPATANIIGGFVDTNNSHSIDAGDDKSNVWLWCNDAGPVRVRIINGNVSTTEDNTINGNDDAANCDFTYRDAGTGTPHTDQGDILDACVNLDEIGGCNGADSRDNVQLFVDP